MNIIRAILLGIVLATPAAAQRMIGYEGPAAKRPLAQHAYAGLLEACPRLAQSSKDLRDYALHVGTPDMKGVQGQLARAMEADMVVIVTIRLVPSPRAVPLDIISRNRFTDLTLVRSPSFTGIVVQDQLAAWFCNTPLASGAPMALLPSQLVGLDP